MAKRFAAAIADPGLKAWGHYETLRVRLHGNNQSADWDWAKQVGTPEQLATGLAWTAVARHNSHINGGDSVFSEVEKSWGDKEELRPFGYAGVALAEVPD